MTTTLRFGLSLCLIALAGACGDDASGEDGGLDGSSGSSGMSGDGDGDGTACDATSTDVTEEQANIISNLSVASDTLVYLSSDPTFADPATIEAVGVDGTGAMTLHTPTGNRRVRSVFAYGDDAYFLEEDGEIVATYELWRVPVAGGDAERIGNSGFESGYIFGVDDTHVFVMHNSATGGLFERAEIASGEIDHVAFVEGSGTPYHVSLSGDDVFFIAGLAGSRAGEPDHVYTFLKTDTESTPTALWEIDDTDPCYLALGGLLPTPTKIACGFSGVGTRDRDGTMPETLIEPDLLQPSKVLVATDAENLYLMERVGPMPDELGHLNRLPSAGGELTPVVCDLNEVGNKLADGSFPRQNEYEVVVGDDSIFWVERRFNGTDNSYLLRSADK